jgi:hypothetical protein
MAPRKSTAPRKRAQDAPPRRQEDPQRQEDPRHKSAKEQTEDVIVEDRERSDTPGDEDIDDIGRPLQLEH